ncbi:MAG: transposase [Candidatus Acidiferrales bacterium]
MGNGKLLVEMPLPMVEVWEELQTQVEQLTGNAGLQIIGTILDEEVARRVGPPHRPDPATSCVRWGRQPGYVVFGGQRVSIPRPRVRTREGEEVALDSYARLQHDGRRQRAVREGIVAGLTTRNYHRAVESVLDGYGIEKSSVSREFVQASAAQLQELCERKLGELDLVALLIDGIEIGKQVLVVALGIASSGQKHVLGLWQGAMENTTVVKSLLEDLVARGLKQDRRYLFVIDGAKALRAGIEKVFGERAEVQRCQIHKRRNGRLRGGQGGAGEDRPATGANQSQRRAQPERGIGRNADGASFRCGRPAAANAVFDQSDRVVPFDGGASGAKREAVARRGSVTSLDGHRVTRSREEIQSHQRSGLGPRGLTSVLHFSRGLTTPGQRPVQSPRAAKPSILSMT